MSKDGLTFVSACLSGSALLEDVDNWVDEWHESQRPETSTVIDLDSFLGFTEEEGAIWAERPESLRFIIAAHRYARPVADLLQGRDDFALAARSVAPDQASAVLQWLRETNRLASSD